MDSTWRTNVITLFPECFPGPLGLSIPLRAMRDGKWRLRVEDLRKHAIGKHRIVDDTPYGGGSGMLIRPDVLDNALCAVANPGGRVVYLSPRGPQFNQSIAQQLVTYPEVTFVCGRYEGVDQRVLDYWNVSELRVSDAVLCGGELAVMVVLEACVRLLPGVIDQESVADETLAEEGIGEYPQYTRPALWNGMGVPDVLFSGHHAQIKEWQKANRVPMSDEFL